MRYVDSDQKSIIVNNLTRSAIVDGLALVPEIGGVLSGIVGAFWEEQADVWPSIKERAEQLVNAKINEFEFIKMTQALDGLYALLHEYRAIIAEKNKDRIKMQWSEINNECILMEPQFLEDGQSDELKMVVAPLAAKFFMVRLCHLLDAIKNGAALGFDDKTTKRYEDEYEGIVESLDHYFDDLYLKHVKKLKISGNYPPGLASWGGIGFPDVYDAVTPLNRYIEVHNFWVLNVFYYVDLWRYMSTKNTAPSPIMRREVYAPVFGHFGSFESGAKPSIPFVPTPIERISKIIIYSGDYIDGVEVFYDGKSSGRQGAQIGGTPSVMELPPGVYADNARVSFSGREGTYNQGVSFIDYLYLASGTEQRSWGKNSQAGFATDVRFPGMCLSSIMSPSVSAYMSVTLFLGFRYLNGYGDEYGANRPDMTTLRALYRATPDRERFLQEIEQRWHMRAEVEKAAKDEGWDQLRWGVERQRTSSRS